MGINDLKTLDFARLMQAMLANTDPELSAAANAAIELITNTDRRKALDPVIAAVSPPKIDPTLWLNWLAGGNHIPTPRLKRVHAPGAARSQQIGKSSNRIATKKKQADALRVQLAVVEDDLAELVALERQVIQYAVTTHLVSAMAEIFAMGPAWTIMRAVSAYADDSDFDEDGGFAFGRKDWKLLYVEDTTIILDALDLYADQARFRNDIRNAILKVCKDGSYLATPGRSMRPSTDYKNSVRTSDTADAKDVLSGL